MSYQSAREWFVLTIISCVLTACALSQAADGLSNTSSESPLSPAQKKVPVDWASARADAKQNDTGIKLFASQIRSPAPTAVPLLLPPESITLSDMLPPIQSLSPAKLITDERGYSAVMEADSFTILIDGSNQTFVTGQSDASSLQLNFDGEYQPTSSGGQVSIGRYGALYAVQLLCTSETRKNCVTERMVREVIESLLVQDTNTP